MPDDLAFRLYRPAPLPEADLRVEPAPRQPLEPGQLRIDVETCGVCRTDLHIAAAEIPAHRLPVTLGHQVVGRIAEIAPPRRDEPHEVPRLAVGDLVGTGWLAWACGTCPACRSGLENLCPYARFTGYDVDGGYAGTMVAEAAFVYPIPEPLSDPVAAAPLLCGGVVGYRALRLAGVVDGAPGRLLLIGFGNSASVVLQAARALGWRCAVSTRSELHREAARELGASWVGSDPPAGQADAAIIFAPAGGLVPVALRAVRPGGVVACAGITMSDIPSFPYALLYGERTLRSVANATRQDARDLLDLAARAGIRTDVELFSLQNARDALGRVAASGLRASGVVRLSG